MSNLATIHADHARGGGRGDQDNAISWSTTDSGYFVESEDGKAFEKGLKQHDDRARTWLVGAHRGGEAAKSPVATREMLGILLAAGSSRENPAGLPPGTRVAHKTGEITAVSHDAAIVYPPGRQPYVLVVLTRGIT